MEYLSVLSHLIALHGNHKKLTTSRTLLRLMSSTAVGCSYNCPELRSFWSSVACCNICDRSSSPAKRSDELLTFAPPVDDMTPLPLVAEMTGAKDDVIWVLLATLPVVPTAMPWAPCWGIPPLRRGESFVFPGYGLFGLVFGLSHTVGLLFSFRLLVFLGVVGVPTAADGLSCLFCVPGLLLLFSLMSLLVRSLGRRDCGIAVTGVSVCSVFTLCGCSFVVFSASNCASNWLLWVNALFSALSALPPGAPPVVVLTCPVDVVGSVSGQFVLSARSDISDNLRFLPFPTSALFSPQFNFCMSNNSLLAHSASILTIPLPPCTIHLFIRTRSGVNPTRPAWFKLIVGGPGWSNELSNCCKPPSPGACGTCSQKKQLRLQLNVKLVSSYVTYPFLSTLSCGSKWKQGVHGDANAVVENGTTDTMRNFDIDRNKNVTCERTLNLPIVNVSIPLLNHKSWFQLKFTTLENYHEELNDNWGLRTKKLTLMGRMGGMSCRLVMRLSKLNWEVLSWE